MKILPLDPDRSATKDDVQLLGANVRTEMADLRTEMRTGFADVRTEIADLRAEVGAEIHGAIGAQTRTMVFSLVGSVTALAITNVVALGLVS